MAGRPPRGEPGPAAALDLGPGAAVAAAGRLPGAGPADGTGGTGATPAGRSEQPEPAGAAPHPAAGAEGSAGAVQVALAAGWRAAAGLAATRALRIATPHSARVPLQQWVEPDTCVLLEREEDAGVRPGLTVSVTPGHPAAIAELRLLSEFGRCEVFGDLGEYLGTEEAELVETVDDTDVLLISHRCKLPVSQIRVQCVSSGGRDQLWLYGLEVTLLPSSRPAGGFSLSAVLARVGAADAPLSDGAEALRAALSATAGRADTPGALLEALVGRRRAETPGGQEEKPKLEAPPTGGVTAAVPGWVEGVVDQCAARVEERLWQRIERRLDGIERKQDAILEKLSALSMKPT